MANDIICEISSENELICEMSSAGEIVVEINGMTYPGVAAELALKADKTYVDSQDALKADLADLEIKADKTYVDSQDALKADQSTTYTKTEVDTSLGLKADKTYVDDKLSEKADAGLLEASFMHRNIFRGKNLGTTITAAQKAAISTGTFDDLYIGDYWVIGGVTYRIADMDYWYNCGDTAFTKHHLVIVPDTSMYNSVMNDTNTTAGGYVGSKMYTEGLTQAKTTIQTAFGELLLTHRDYLVNAVTSGWPSAGAWFDSTVELMNEIMVYGSHIYTPGSTGPLTPIRYTINKQQLAIFALNPKMINNRNTIWLRDVVSSVLFANVAYGGFASSYYASLSYGVRPVFAIG